MIPILSVTMGDVNGVGPEIIAKAFADAEIWRVCSPVVFGSASVYESAAADVPHAPAAMVVNTLDACVDVPKGRLPFFECGVDAPVYEPGTLSAEAGRCAMEWIEHAVRSALDGSVDGIVTCPINKEGIHAAGYTVRGHTDFIANMTGTLSYRMCLFTNSLRILHLSDHVPLREAIELVNTYRIVETIRMAHDILVSMNTPSRRIAVAGLNPHAGEGGAFGDEDEGEIAPAVIRCQHEDIDCTGPISPDAVFRDALNGQYDAVVAMYHDQGHIPLASTRKF